MTRPKLALWWLGAAAVTLLVWYCNLGYAWWGTNAVWYHVPVTLVYLIFWCLFTWKARGRGKTGAALTAVAALHLFSALCSTLARLTLKGALPAFLSGPLTAGALVSPFPAGVVFFGFTIFAGRDWTALYALTSALWATWMLWCIYLRQKT